MQLAQYLRKEIFKSAVAVTLVLTVIAISNKVVRLLSRAASGQLPPDWVFTLILVELPDVLSYLMPLCWLLGIILAVSKLYSDNEMTAMYATGTRWQTVFKHISTMSVPVALFAGLLSIFIAPFGDELKESLLKQDESLLLMQTLSPGRFVTLRDGRMVFYVENVSDNRRSLKEVFIAEQPWGRPDVNDEWGVLAAKSGQILTMENGEQFIEMYDGARYEGTPGEVNYQVVEFETYGRRLTFESQHNRIYGTYELYKRGDKRAQAEIAWRLSIPLGVFLMGLIALPLSRVHPRAGRFAKVIPGVVAFILYFNALSFIKRSVMGGSLSLSWILLPHVIMLFVALYLGLKDSGWIHKVRHEKA